jgi:transcriptional regulator of acetoin/glycerol metabolism
MSLSSGAVYAIVQHAWPHNVRELEQRIKTAVVLAVDGRIELPHLWKDGPPVEGASRSSSMPPPMRAFSDQDESLRNELVAKLTEHRGNVTHVGEAMGKSRTQIQRWVRRLGIDAERFRR